MKWLIVAAVVIGLVAWLVTRSGSARRRPTAGALGKRLRKLTHDPLVAERLVASEMKRHPEMDEASALRRVLGRLERDRR